MKYRFFYIFIPYFIAYMLMQMEASQCSKNQVQINVVLTGSECWKKQLDNFYSRNMYWAAVLLR